MSDRKVVTLPLAQGLNARRLKTQHLIGGGETTKTEGL